MKQPVLGLVASAIGIVLALAFISLFDLPTFLGPVAFYMLCIVPFQVMAVVIWGANPSFVAKLSQPAKGLVLLVVTLVAGAVIAPLVLRVVGEGISPPGPIPSHFAVIVVPTTFWLAIMWGGWPFNLFGRDPLVAGLTLLAAAYVITWVIFRVFFNYDFLQGAPVYLASAPQGQFNAVSALVFYVTALAVMFLVLCFDLWPFTKVPSLMQQPALGLVWTIVCAAGAWIVMQVTVSAMGMDPMVGADAHHRAVHLRQHHRAEHVPELAVRDARAAGEGRAERRRRGRARLRALRRLLPGGAVRQRPARRPDRRATTSRSGSRTRCSASRSRS